jgi:soluble lytic murein transglycosylase-like protein
MTVKLRFKKLGVLLGMVLAASAHADLYGYVDQQGIIHLANHKLTAEYQLFKKGLLHPLTAQSNALNQVLPQQKTDASSAPSLAFAPTGRGAGRWSDLIRQTANDFQLDPHLLHSIISVESGYNANALSPKGAIGLMQVMPTTGQRFGVFNLNDPKQNLIAGARYLQSLQAQFNGNLPLVIAAYNAGEGAVQKYRNTIPPYAETREYVSKVMASYHRHQAGGTETRTQGPLLSSRSVLIIRGDEPITTDRW